MDDQTSSYTYVPLDASKRQIRLLHLLPLASINQTDSSYEEDHDLAQSIRGLKNNDSAIIDIDSIGDIHCTFSVVSLDDDPDYEALSYVWGDQNDLVTIYVHGHPIAITWNLYGALLNMRQTQERILWADALCVNQKDLAERASQVLEMGSIFGQASTVVVYLGALEDAGVTFHLIEALATDHLEHYYDAASMHAAIKSRGLDLDADTAKRYLLELFSLPWWHRVWTVQEYVLAKRMVFQSGSYLLMGFHMRGFNDSVNYHTICCGRGGRLETSWLRLSNPSLVAGLAKIDALHNFKNPESRFNMQPLRIATFFRDRHCSDPLDHIYGILGLANPIFQLKLRPDYYSAPGAAYTSATMTWISDTRTLNALSLAFGIRSDTLDIPTYVPDLSAPANQAAFLHRLRIVEEQFYATKESEATLSVCPSLKATTHAIFIDTLLKIVSERAKIYMISPNEEELVCSNSRVFTRYVSLSQACWQTVCGGIVPGVISENGNATYRLVQEDDYAMFQKWQAWDDSKMTDDRETIHFQIAASVAGQGRNYAITNTGYLGLVPYTARPGDHLVLMPGGRVPYIIRRVRESKKRRHWEKRNATRQYEFVGDCYIHGIMHGEAWDESKLEKVILV